MKLTLKDRKILAELDLNARTSFQELGRKIHLSKETVTYRVRSLEKRGIIGRYTTLVNFGQLGYTGYAVFNRFQNVDQKKREEIITYLKGIPELYWIAMIGGKFDIVFAMMCKSVTHFNKLYYRILTQFGDNLVDNTIAIRTELHQHKRNYLTEEQPADFTPPFFGKEPSQAELDDLDSNILSLLSNNARVNVVELARLLKKPASSITFRMKQLKERGIIQGYTTYIRAQQYGMQSYRLLLRLQHMDEETRTKLFEYANQNDSMILAIECVGEWNFELTLEVESHERLQEEIFKLRDEFKTVIKNLEFIIMFECDLIYDPYPLKKLEREQLLKN